MARSAPRPAGGGISGMRRGIGAVGHGIGRVTIGVVGFVRRLGFGRVDLPLVAPAALVSLSAFLGASGGCRCRPPWNCRSDQSWNRRPCSTCSARAGRSRTCPGCCGRTTRPCPAGAGRRRRSRRPECCCRPASRNRHAPAASAVLQTLRRPAGPARWRLRSGVTLTTESPLAMISDRRVSKERASPVSRIFLKQNQCLGIAVRPGTRQDVSHFCLPARIALSFGHRDCFTGMPPILKRRSQPLSTGQ